MYRYNDLFYQYVTAGAQRSARFILPWLFERLSIRSVVDLGAGQGAWLAVWRELGVQDVVGVDGPSVPADTLLVDVKYFRFFDLQEPIDLGRTFDLVQSLEVGEHIAPGHVKTFIDSLVRHGSVILFSSAVPGQGGENHINEQPLEYWRNLFVDRGYHAFDAVRPRIHTHSDIEPWYRFNTLLYVREDAICRLPEEVARTEIALGALIRDFSNPAWRLRKVFLRWFPRRTVTELAIAKHFFLRFTPGKFNRFRRGKLSRGR